MSFWRKGSASGRHEVLSGEKVVITIRLMTSCYGISKSCCLLKHAWWTDLMTFNGCRSRENCFILLLQQDWHYIKPSSRTGQEDELILPWQRLWQNDTYSWHGIVCGWSELKTDEKRVRRRISYTSELRLCSAPSFWPEVRWEQTKHIDDWKSDMLTDTDPCIRKSKIYWGEYGTISNMSIIINSRARNLRVAVALGFFSTGNASFYEHFSMKR